MGSQTSTGYLALWLTLIKCHLSLESSQPLVLGTLQVLRSCRKQVWRHRNPGSRGFERLSPPGCLHCTRKAACDPKDMPVVLKGRVMVCNQLLSSPPLHSCSSCWMFGGEQFTVHLSSLPPSRVVKICHNSYVIKMNQNCKINVIITISTVMSFDNL